MGSTDFNWNAYRARSRASRVVADKTRHLRARRALGSAAMDNIGPDVPHVIEQEALARFDRIHWELLDDACRKALVPVPGVAFNNLPAEFHLDRVRHFLAKCKGERSNLRYRFGQARRFGAQAAVLAEPDVEPVAAASGVCCLFVLMLAREHFGGERQLDPVRIGLHFTGELRPWQQQSRGIAAVQDGP